MCGRMCASAFEKLKNKLIIAPILMTPTWKGGMDRMVIYNGASEKDWDMY